MDKTSGYEPEIVGSSPTVSIKTKEQEAKIWNDLARVKNLILLSLVS